MATPSTQPTATNAPEGAQLRAERRGAAARGQRRNQESSFTRALREASIAAVLVGVLGFFFLAIRSDIAPGGLAISTRWGLWLSSIAIVFVVRLLLNLFVFREGGVSGGAFSRIGGSIAASGIGTILGYVLFGFALVLPFFFTYFFPGKDRQFIDLAILIMTYIMLGWGLNIVVGLAGLLDLGYVAFYAVGAYSFALFST